MHVSTIHLAAADAEQLIDHARRDAPNECCGLLLGVLDDGVARVERVLPAVNIAEGDRRTRYQVDWRTLIQAYRDTRRGGAAVLGSYHSHPTGRAVPSTRDAELAAPGQVVLIIASPASTDLEIRAWVRDERRMRGVPMIVEAVLSAR